MAGIKKTVLVVDDDASLRTVAADMFGDLGVEVIEAVNGHHALAELDARPDIGILFSDCRMPGMSGPELASIASVRWPDLEIILVSGVSDVRPVAWPLVPKPYDRRIIEGIVYDPDRSIKYRAA